MLLQLFAFLSLAYASDCSTPSPSSRVTAEQCRVQKEKFEKHLNVPNSQTATSDKSK